MNVEIGTETPIFLFWEYLFQIFGILSLQCGVADQDLYCRTSLEKMDSATKTYKQGLLSSTKTKSFPISLLPILYTKHDRF
jgi:hypothetical protein